MNSKLKDAKMKTRIYPLIAFFILFSSSFAPTALAGSILGWGWNDYGQATPPYGNDFIAIAAGGEGHSVALRSNGSIVGWGCDYDWCGNWAGQALPPGNNFIAIAAGGEHFLALRSDGTIVGWGCDYDWWGNWVGQATPPAGNNFIAIAAGEWHSLALRSDGSIVGWGDNDYGQATPPDGNNYIAIAAGLSHSLALCSDGSIVSWGSQVTPPDGDNYIAIATGGEHSLALRSDGSIVGWGSQVTTPDGDNYITIAAGGGHSLALRSDGSIVGWGDNYFGQATPPDENNYIAIAAGEWHSLAIKQGCQYELAGDLNDDRKVDFYDFAQMAQDWLIDFNFLDLDVMTENWLIDCNIDPNNPACYDFGPIWHDKPGLSARVRRPLCVYNDKVYMGGITSYGLESWDGSQISKAAKVGSLTTGLSFLWPLTLDGNIGIIDKNYILTGIGAVTFTGAGLNNMTAGGSFSGTTALRYKIEIDGTGTPDAFKWSDDGGTSWDANAVAITGSAQTLNNGVTVTFATTTGHTVGNYWTLLNGKSRIEITSNPDTTDFTDVTPVGFSINEQALHRSFIDCGFIGDWNGGKRVLLWFEYTLTDATSQAWYSDDNGLTWTKFFNAAAAIVHFHGGIFVKGVGAKDGRLYVFTGDSASAASILICDDVNDLLTNSGTWFGSTHWALGSGNRTGWSPNGDYVLGWNDQKWRTVDMVSDGEYGYWIPDAKNYYDIAVYRVKHSTKVVETLAKYPTVIGAGWIGLCTSKGQVLFTTYSWSTGKGFTTGTDEFVRLYYLTAGGVAEIARWRHAGYNPFVSPVIYPPSNEPAFFQQFFEYKGNLYLGSDRVEGVNFDLLGCKIRPYVTKVGEIDEKMLSMRRSRYEIYQDDPPALIDNPVNDHDFSIWNGDKYTSWEVHGETWTRDTNIVEPGFTYSAKCVVESGTPYLRQTITNTAILNSLKGYYCILLVKVRVASGATATFLPNIVIQKVLGANPEQWFSPHLEFCINNTNSNTAYADDKWHEIWLSTFIPTDITYMRIWLQANDNSGKTGTVYFSNIRIQRGSNPFWQMITWKQQAP